MKTRTGYEPPPPILSPQSLAKLAERLRTARLEACRNDECDCITQEEHERNLAQTH